jgi:hypothetical protein
MTIEGSIGMNNCLEFCLVLFRVFAVPKALGTDAAKRQILRRAHLNVAAAFAGERFATANAVLQKHNLILHDATHFVDYLLNVIVALNREKHRVPVIVQAQMHQVNEFLSFQPR